MAQPIRHRVAFPVKPRLALLIGLRQLAAHPQRFLGSLVGVAVAIALILLLASIRASLYESAVTLHRSLDADLVLVSKHSNTLLDMQRFPIDLLYEAAATPGIATARPLYADVMPWRNPVTGMPRLIYIFAFDPERPVLRLPEVNRQAAALRDPGAVLFDRRSRPEFGPIASWLASKGSVRVALAYDRHGLDPLIRVEGLYSLGAGFMVTGDVIAGDLTFHDITGLSLDQVMFGILKIVPGQSVARVQAAVQARVGDGVRVLRKSQLIAAEQAFWARHTPLGFMFDLVLLIGFVVGIAFAYQVLYIVVHESLAEYAVLRSLGYSTWFLNGVVFTVGLAVGLGATIPAVAAAAAVIAAIHGPSGLPIRLELPDGAIGVAAAIAMCLVAAAVAARRLRACDPVELFG